MSEYRQAHDRYTFQYFWLISGVTVAVAVAVVVWTVAGLVQGQARPHPGLIIAMIAIVIWDFWLMNGRVVRAITVTPAGEVHLDAPWQHRVIRAADVEYLGPAFTRDFLELRYRGGRSFLLKSMNGLEQFEAEMRGFNSTFQGRNWRAA